VLKRFTVFYENVLIVGYAQQAFGEEAMNCFKTLQILPLSK
jgi:hypothetical protein